ncbi:MAG: hypothetical protein M1837_001482 [Sclerophora amabilis]|nr:MAG: hypothetical protein M1837_001482 [Sclerophora amabilis]
MALRNLASSLLLLSSIKPIIAGYDLSDDYSGKSFFSGFSFFTGPDPTQGFVQYVDLKTAAISGLVGASNDTVYLGVDRTNPAPLGRASVRLESKKTFNKGLFIADIKHMPGGICGTWPAFWMVGSNWPDDGEIDILEGVNDQAQNAMTLHTSAGCVSTSPDHSGMLETDDCDVNAPHQHKNAGCKITHPSTSSYGADFNAHHGGVYATEWTSQAIKIWFFTRDRIPHDIAAGTPNPSTWGQPSAHFAGDCDIDSRFHDLRIIFDTTFCGDWAGDVWDSAETCTALPHGRTCDGFVANNPTAFRDAYWEINSLKIYQEAAAAAGYDQQKRRHVRQHARRPRLGVGGHS